jgi:hypothetical protein
MYFFYHCTNVLYSSTLQRIGCKNLAQQLFTVLKQRLGRLFDQVHNYYDIAGAMIHTCTYLAGEGELQQSTIYYTLGLAFLKAEKSRQDSNMALVNPAYYKSLSDFCEFCEVISLTDTLTKIRAVGRLFCSVYLSATFDDGPLDPTRYNSDPEYLRGILDVIDLLELKTKAFHYQGLKQQGLNEISPSALAQLSIADVHYEFMLQGIRLSIFIKTGLTSFDLAKQCADRVTAITQSPWFEKCAMPVIDPIANCATIHLSDHTTPVHILEQDLKALRILNERFNATTKLYGHILKALDERIKSNLNMLPIMQ